MHHKFHSLMEIGEIIYTYNKNKKNKYYKTIFFFTKLSQNYIFKTLYYKTTDLTVNLFQNYTFKAEYHKTTDFILNLSQNYRFNIEVITKIHILEFNP